MISNNVLSSPSTESSESFVFRDLGGDVELDRCSGGVLLVELLVVVALLWCGLTGADIGAGGCACEMVEERVLSTATGLAWMAWRVDPRFVTEALRRSRVASGDFFTNYSMSINEIETKKRTIILFSGFQFAFLILISLAD
jgi:hypothetical protein